MTYRVSAASLVAITVTYHPDLVRLAKQIQSLPAEAGLIIVDNASDAHEVEAIKDMVRIRRHSCVLENAENTGLAAAINRGAEYASAAFPRCDFLLLMDQDSLPVGDSIERLAQAYLDIERKGVRVGSVGPLLIDEATGLQHGFHCAGRWRLKRIFPEEHSVEPVSCVNLNGSGTLVRPALFQQLGRLDATFFIDHVDTDWAFRVLAAEYHLFGIPQARFIHRMGDKGLRFWWFGWRVWPYRQPLRHYYLFRNAVRLLRRNHVPFVWKFWVPVKLAITVAVHGIFDSQRRAQLSQMAKGIAAGWSFSSSEQQRRLP